MDNISNNYNKNITPKLVEVSEDEHKRLCASLYNADEEDEKLTEAIKEGYRRKNLKEDKFEKE